MGREDENEVVHKMTEKEKHKLAKKEACEKKKKELEAESPAKKE